MAVPSSKSSPSSFGASAFELAQKCYVVQIGLKVGALDVLREEERFSSRCMPLGTVDGGCGIQIGANLVFLQDQPSGPLTPDAKKLRCRGSGSM